MQTFADLDGGDLERTACHAIADVIARRLGEADRVIVAGGGVHNAALMQELDKRIAKLERSDEHGVASQFREAVAMAVLGALCADRVPIMLPQVTSGQSTIVSGAWVRP